MVSGGGNHRFQPDENATRAQFAQMPVSYTHLDVYKRQAANGAFGAVVGAAEGASVIRRCENRAELETTLNVPTGGILGKSLTAADGVGVALEDCLNKGGINTSKMYAGGIAGWLSGGYARIYRCENTGGIVSVSYTHLDVYKRQG